MIVKLLLIVALCVSALVLFRGKPSATRLAATRILVTLVVACGVLAVLFPNSVTEVANLVGVGRGADLLLYLVAVTFLLTTVAQYRRLTELEAKHVTLVRQIAVMKAQRMNPAAAPQQLPSEETSTAVSAPRSAR